MKEIKFRAWWTHTHNMMQWEQIAKELGMCELDGLTPNLIWMQYTGLKDKKGKEVYESDHLMSDKGLHMTVFWSNARACYSVRFLNIWGKRTDSFSTNRYGGQAQGVGWSAISTRRI